MHAVRNLYTEMSNEGDKKPQPIENGFFRSMMDEEEIRCAKEKRVFGWQHWWA